MKKISISVLFIFFLGCSSYTWHMPAKDSGIETYGNVFKIDNMNFLVTPEASRTSVYNKVWFNLAEKPRDIQDINISIRIKGSSEALILEQIRYYAYGLESPSINIFWPGFSKFTDLPSNLKKTIVNNSEIRFNFYFYVPNGKKINGDLIYSYEIKFTDGEIKADTLHLVPNTTYFCLPRHL
jgi:hypothetical protein